MTVANTLSPLRYAATLRQHGSLLWQLTKREFGGRYRGSLLGLFWALVLPICMLAIYTFIFSIVFQMRWGAEVSSPADFALILFAGMIVHGIFAECAQGAPGLILGHVTYVKKVVFPLEILPVVKVANATLHAGIGFVVLLTFHMAVHGSLNWTILYLPVLAVPYLLFNLGFVLFLSAVGVFLRDIAQIVGVVVMMSLFLTPIFYPLEAVPATFRAFMYLNPLTFAVEQVRAVIIFGKAPDWAGLAAYTAGACVTAWLGFAWFQKTRKGFADVL